MSAKTPMQSAYYVIAQEADAQMPYPADAASMQAQISYVAGLRRALVILLQMDPDADPGPSVPGRVY